LLILLASLPFLFLIMALSMSRGEEVRSFFWPSEEEGVVAVEEPPVEEEAAVEAEEEPVAPSSGVGVTRADVGRTVEYRPEEEFEGTREMSPDAHGQIFVDHELASGSGGSSVYGPEASGTRALESMPEGDAHDVAPEGSDLTAEEQRRDVVEQAEAEPPVDSIHDESFTPSEPIVLPDSGIVLHRPSQPASEPDVGMLDSDPVIAVPGPGDKDTDMPGPGDSDPVLSLPPSKVAPEDSGLGPGGSDLIIEELGSKIHKKGKKDTKVAPAGEQPDQGDAPPPSGKKPKS
jgi:hypothetical protein